MTAPLTTDLAAILAADLPAPEASTVWTRVEARRAAIAVLGGGLDLYGQRTETLVERARTRLADEAAQHVGEHTCVSTRQGVAVTWASNTLDCPVRQRYLAAINGTPASWGCAR